MSRTRPAACFWLALCLLAFPGRAEEIYSFNPDEFEKKRFTWGGFLEAGSEHFDLNGDGALAILNQYREPRAELNRFTAALQLDGRFQQGITTLNWLLKGWAAQDEVGSADDIDLYTGYASIKASQRLTLDLGKKTFKWGKGYAWNPVAFIDRPKNPDDPEEALEGFIDAGADLVRSMNGPLRTLALTGVVLPVWQGVNEDFGAADNVNLGAKLYLLLLDTDIDFLLYTGNSRSTRFGLDFSRNLAPNFEIHGELAHTPAQQQMYLTESGDLTAREVSDTSALIGLRYLTEREVTAIVDTITTATAIPRRSCRASTGRWLRATPSTWPAAGTRCLSVPPTTARAATAGPRSGATISMPGSPPKNPGTSSTSPRPSRPSSNWTTKASPSPRN